MPFPEVLCTPFAPRMPDGDWGDCLLGWPFFGILGAELRRGVINQLLEPEAKSLLAFPPYEHRSLEVPGMSSAMDRLGQVGGPNDKVLPFFRPTPNSLNLGVNESIRLAFIPTFGSLDTGTRQFSPFNSGQGSDGTKKLLPT